MERFQFQARTPDPAGSSHNAPRSGWLRTNPAARSRPITSSAVASASARVADRHTTVTDAAFSHDGACTNQAESLFSRFRRAEWGQYHRLSGIYLARYASEIGWREDYRRESNGEQFSRLGARAAALAQSVDFTGRWQQRE